MGVTSRQGHLTLVPENLDPAGDLTELATALNSGDCTVILLPWGSMPHLRVTSRDTGRTGDVYCDGRHFWWGPYGQPIAAAGEVAFTAQAVRLVLAAGTGVE